MGIEELYIYWLGLFISLFVGIQFIKIIENKTLEEFDRGDWNIICFLGLLSYLGIYILISAIIIRSFPVITESFSRLWQILIKNRPLIKRK